MPKSVGLFGGTFDPVHNGHLSIINSYLESSLLDRLVVTLTPHPPHKPNRELTDYRHRLNMLQLALEGISRLQISTIEQKLPVPSYTINTLDWLHDEYSDAQLYLCIGEDSFKAFTSWHKWQKILDICTLMVARRPGTDKGKPKTSKELIAHTRFIDHEPVDISSSEVRKKIRGGININDILPAAVIAYIQQHNLYTQ